MDEIKELYVEEVALLKRIQNYGKDRSQEKLDRLEKVVLLLLYRIYTNLFSAMLLTVEAHKKQKTSFFLLPCGVLLRCAFTDCLFALYFLYKSNYRTAQTFPARDEPTPYSMKTFPAMFFAGGYEIILQFPLRALMATHWRPKPHIA